MFSKRTKAVKAFSYQMLLSFSFTPDNCVRSESALAGQNSIFCRTLSSDVQC